MLAEHARAIAYEVQRVLQIEYEQAISPVKKKTYLFGGGLATGVFTILSVPSLRLMSCTDIRAYF
jgi:hypothetical protein